MSRLVLLASIAAACACGAKRAPAPSVAAPAELPTRRDEIDRLDRQIANDLAALQLPAPVVAPDAVSANPLVAPLPTRDPTCQHDTSQSCSDTCRLADSICDSAGKICEIASELGDDYAREKCASGRASCDAARGRCCGCATTTP